MGQILNQKKLNNVHFIDFILPEELRRYYMAADIFVFPTRADAWGLVINEAMAVGLPIITTYECGAGSEMINEGQNGLLYRAEDTWKLTEYLVRLMQAEQTRKEMGENALKFIKKYTIEEMVATHYNILQINKNGKQNENGK